MILVKFTELPAVLPRTKRTDCKTSIYIGMEYINYTWFHRIPNVTWSQVEHFYRPMINRQRSINFLLYTSWLFTTDINKIIVSKIKGSWSNYPKVYLFIVSCNLKLECFFYLAHIFVSIKHTDYLLHIPITYKIIKTPDSISNLLINSENLPYKAHESVMAANFYWPLQPCSY